jgi:outer membrane protein
MHVMSFRRLMVAVATVVPLTFSVAAHAEAKFGYVDLQRALGEVEEGKGAKARLEAMKEQKQKELDKAQEDLKKEKDVFDKQAATMTEQVRNEKGAALQKKLIELQQTFEKGRAELAQKQNDEIQAIFGKMTPIITSIAQREGFTMVFERNDAGLIYAPPSLDLTNELVRIYNDQNKGKGGATPASAKKPDTSSPKKSDKK